MTRGPHAPSGRARARRSPFPPQRPHRMQGGGRGFDTRGDRHRMSSTRQSRRRNGGQNIDNGTRSELLSGLRAQGPRSHPRVDRGLLTPPDPRPGGLFGSPPKSSDATATATSPPNSSTSPRPGRSRRHHRAQRRSPAVGMGSPTTLIRYTGFDNLLPPRAANWYRNSSAPWFATNS